MCIRLVGTGFVRQASPETCFDGTALSSESLSWFILYCFLLLVTMALSHAGALRRPQEMPIVLIRVDSTT